MAKAYLNPVFNGLSGKSGGMVFRRLGAQTILAKRPDTKERTASRAQQAQRDRFAQAGAYAKQVLSDPWQRRSYEVLAKERNRRADKLVAGDFLNPPVVDEIDVSGYQRRPGGVIRIFATDDIEVVSVHVAIETPDGIVEQAAASKLHGVWCYTATSAAPAGAALTITATAKDRPGHNGGGRVVCP
jgi:hypothetical protein